MAEPMVYEVEINGTDEPALLSTREDYDLVRQFRWYMAGNGYAASNLGGSRTYLHRFIMRDQLAHGLVVDHINRDKLDNRRENLRVCTQQQNVQNRRRWGRSPYRGVLPSKGRWKVQVSIDGITTYFGTYDSAEEAARIYDNRARAFYGEFANLNFPDAA